MRWNCTSREAFISTSNVSCRSSLTTTGSMIGLSAGFKALIVRALGARDLVLANGLRIARHDAAVGDSRVCERPNYHEAVPRVSRSGENYADCSSESVDRRAWRPSCRDIRLNFRASRLRSSDI